MTARKTTIYLVKCADNIIVEIPQELFVMIPHLSPLVVHQGVWGDNTIQPDSTQDVVYIGPIELYTIRSFILHAILSYLDFKRQYEGTILLPEQNPLFSINQEHMVELIEAVQFLGV